MCEDATERLVNICFIVQKQCVLENSEVFTCSKGFLKLNPMHDRHAGCCACCQEEEEWQEVVGDLPTGLRGRVVMGVLRHTCRQLLEQLAAGAPLCYVTSKEH